MKSVLTVILVSALTVSVTACGGGGGGGNSPPGPMAPPPAPPPPPPPPSGTGLIFEGEFGSFGSEIGQFDRTRAVTVDNQGRIAIADRENSRIQICDDQGIVCTAFGQPGSAVGDFLSPQGITVDSLDRIIISDFGNLRVQVCDDVGLCTAFGSQGSALGQFEGVVGIDVDSQDRIFISDPANDRVQICDDQGVCTAFDIAGPHGVAVDSQDRIIVTSIDSHSVFICNDQGACTSFGARGSEPGLFNEPFDVATDSQDRIFVADRSNDRVQICDETGNCLAFGGPGTGPGRFNLPGGIAVDNQDRLVVGDTFNHRIQVFSLGTETPTVTVVSASPTYAAGTTFNADGVSVTSMTDDPLGPFSGQSVTFEGVNRDGVLQVYQYRIEFIQDVTLDSIVLEGRAWDNSVVTVRDEQQNIIGTFNNLLGGSSFQRHVLDVSGITGRVFYLDENNTDTIWRYRSLIEINFSGGFLGN